MRRTILALILVLSAVLPARAQTPNSINIVARGMGASSCIPPAGETADDVRRLSDE
jgi:hypothetical protein